MATNESLTDDPVTEPTQPNASASTTPSDGRRSTVWEMATIIANSRDFPNARTPEKAAVRIMAGAEIGIGPLAAISGLHIEKGKISTSAAIFESIIDRSEIYDWTLKERTDTACEIEFFRRGESRGTIRYTLDDAKKAGIASGDNWKKHPAAMLFAAAFRTGARAFCAGAFGGNAVYTYEELGYTVDSEGNYAGDDSGGGNDLCTRDQRAEITRLLEAAGKTLAQYTEGLGIRLLDELSGQEADKEIKKLAKMAAKKADGGKPSNTAGKAPVVSPDPESTKEVKDATIPASQQTLIDAQEESRKPSTAEQKRQIIELAQALGLETDDIKAVLAKRNCEYISQLSYLQAAALIEGMIAKCKETGVIPF